MKKDKLLELSQKLGIKKENFEFGMKEKPKETEAQIAKAAEFMGLITK